MSNDSVCLGDLFVRIGGMCVSRVEIEQCGFVFVCADEADFTIALAEVECLFIAEYENVVSTFT